MLLCQNTIGSSKVDEQAAHFKHFIMQIMRYNSRKSRDEVSQKLKHLFLDTSPGFAQQARLQVRKHNNEELKHFLRWTASSAKVLDSIKSRLDYGDATELYSNLFSFWNHFD